MQVFARRVRGGFGQGAQAAPTLRRTVTGGQLTLADELKANAVSRKMVTREFANSASEARPMSARNRNVSMASERYRKPAVIQCGTPRWPRFRAASTGLTARLSECGHDAAELTQHPIPCKRPDASAPGLLNQGRYQAMSNRSSSITFTQAATKSSTNFARLSALP